MSEFKVGDKVRFVEDFGSYEKGDVVEVINKNVYCGEQTVDFTGKNGNGNTYITRVELVTKKQRIASLEETVELQEQKIADLRNDYRYEVEQQQNEINELKVIVHQLRTPSEQIVAATPSIVEGKTEIIKFEGREYFKVERLAREGDVAIARSQKCMHAIETDKPYKVVKGNGDKLFLDSIDFANVYDDWYNRTPETVDVYELYAIPWESDKTPNELRAEIIEKAKVFVKENTTYNAKAMAGAGVRVRSGWVCIPDFIVNESKRTVVLLLRLVGDKQVVQGRSIAKCMRSDVFNEHIGKAIALGRALGLEVSEFEQAVQPNRRVDGMVMEWRGKKRVIAVPYIDGETCDFDSEIARYGTIINDTNAQYRGVE